MRLNKFNARINGERRAALEAFEGRYETAELGQMVEQETVIEQAIALILKPESDRAKEPLAE